MDYDYTIDLSKHALEKMNARGVKIEDIKETIRDPKLLFEDKESKTKNRRQWSP